MPSERHLDLRREDPHLGPLGVVHEDRLGEAKVGGNCLPLRLRHLAAVQEHSERVPMFARGRGEDAKDVELAHPGDDSQGRETRRRGCHSSNATPRRGFDVTERFRRGDRVEWNFRGHTVTGRVRKRLVERTEVAGQVVAASKDDPRYLVRSDKSGRETARKPEALKRLA